MPILPGIDASGLRVLLCAPERHIARLIQVNLERQKYVVTTTYSSAKAIEALAESLEGGLFFLAVLDDDLPDESMKDIVDWIRNHEQTDDMRIIVLDRARRNGSGLNFPDPPDSGGSFPPPPAVYETRPFSPIDVLKGWLRW